MSLTSAKIIDGTSKGFGAGAGNAQLEVLVAVLEKMGYITGVDLYKILDTADFAKMRDGAGIVNCARGGTISEDALLQAMDSGKVKYIATDVFEKEPPVDERILRVNSIGLSPHIGASTAEAQEKIGIELAEQIIGFFNK